MGLEAFQEDAMACQRCDVSVWGGQLVCRVPTYLAHQTRKTGCGERLERQLNDRRGGVLGVWVRRLHLF